MHRATGPGRTTGRPGAHVPPIPTGIPFVSIRGLLRQGEAEPLGGPTRASRNQRFASVTASKDPVCSGS